MLRVEPTLATVWRSRRETSLSDELAGKAVVVTGAGRGLGRAFAEAIVAAGGSVVVNDVDADVAEQATEEVAASGGRAVAAVGNVAAWDEAAAVVERCVRAFGRIDGLVNNAGLFYARSPLEEREHDLRDIVEANVLGPLFTGVHAMRAMGRTGGGCIVNIGSEAMLGYATMGAYATTKGAIASLTYAWSHHREETGVRVNAVTPNAQTRMSPPGPDGKPLPRPPASSVAPVVVYLLSDAACAINGKVLKFNGTTLAPISPAALSDEPAFRESWTVAEIAAACEGQLAGRLHGSAGPTAHDAGR